MPAQLTNPDIISRSRSTAAAAYHMRDVIERFAEHQHRFRPKQWQVMHLYYDEGLTQEQIADRLGVSRSAVSARLGRARAEMEAILREQRPDRRELEQLLRSYLES